MGFTVKGKSIKQILSMSGDEFNSLSAKEMKSAVSRLNSAANKRLKRFGERGESSPAVRGVKKNHPETGKFSLKGSKTLNDYRRGFVDVKNFLDAKTSTFKGWQEVKKDTIKALEKKHEIKITNEQFDDFWNTYEELKEANPAIKERQYKYSVLESIDEKMKAGVPIDDLIEQMKEELAEIYENGVSDEGTSTSVFFE